MGWSKIFGLILCSCIVGCTFQKERPNILFIIADDMSRGQTSFEGNPALHTPNLDFLAENGVFFENAYCSAPSCSPSRAAILTGRNGYELEEGAGLAGHLPSKFKTYTDILDETGYHVGYTGKGWAPGSVEMADRKHNPAGQVYNKIKWNPFPELGSDGGIYDIDYAANFDSFLNQRKGQPFCFWYGAFEPHRVFDQGIGLRAGKSLKDVVVPPYLPDNDRVRSEFLDYFFEIEWIDTQVGKMIDILKARGELDNTLIVFTSDNGMPFPRAKATLYQDGIQMPLYAYWANEIEKGRRVSDFVNLADLAPTFLEIAGVEVPEDMSARSFVDVLLSNQEGQVNPDRDFVVTYKERHSIVQKKPEDIAAMRAIRKGDYLLIWNLFPELWPLGHINPAYNPFLMPFGDAGDGIAKEELIKTYTQDSHPLFDLSFMPKGVEYELYDVRKDPYNLNNLAEMPEMKEVLEKLKTEMENYLKKTGDPRMVGGAEVFAQARYHGWQGLASGAMSPARFETLNAEEKEEAMEKAYSMLDEKRIYLESLGWNLDSLDSIQ